MKQLIILLLTLVVTPTMMAQSSLDIVIFGDSNTWYGGDNCDKPRGWNKWFKDAFHPATIRSYARSGATWTNTTVTKRNTQENTARLGNENVIYNQIERLKEAIDSGLQRQPQLILIMAGTNDAWFQKDRPKVFDVTAEEAFAIDNLKCRPVSQVISLAESVRYDCELLQTVCPQARIILLTPMQSTAAGIANIAKAGDVIEECGRLLHLSVIRLDQEAVDTRDGTHTSELGAQHIGTYIAQQIATLLSK